MSDRILREKICTSLSLAQVSAGAERLFYRNLTHCDAHGRFQADPSLVLAKCFPRQMTPITVDEIAEWLDELQRVETIEFYEDRLDYFGRHPSWLSHNAPRAKPKYPDPPSRITRIWMVDVLKDQREAKAAVDEFRQRMEQQPGIRSA